MAQAYKCDRCKKLKEGGKHGTVAISKARDDDDYQQSFSLDLCFECYKEVDIFIAAVPPRALPLNPPKL